MDLEKIREFVRFSESLNFTDAARELHMSQSSLSKHIRDLEGELEMNLVERGVNGGHNALRPTGHRFLELVEPWLRDYEHIVEECREIQNAVPPVRIMDARCSIKINSQLRRALEAHGVTSGNFSHVMVQKPFRQALDQGMVDFAYCFDSTSETHMFSGSDLAATYGCLPLDPEPLRFLVGVDNPLAHRAEAEEGHGTIALGDIRNTQVITIDTSAYTNWQNATSNLFAAYDCKLHFRVVPDTPTTGGAFPIGPRNLVLVTKRFAQYYRDLDAEDICMLRVAEFEPVVYPFLVYRRDNSSPGVRRIVEAMGKEK